MPNNTLLSDDEVLGPRQAQDRLAAMFAEPKSATAGDDIEGPETGDVNSEDRGIEGDGDRTEVISLDGEVETVLPENPFAKEAALVAVMRRVEALLFASSAPLAASVIAERVGTANVVEVLEKLAAHYQHRGVNLRQVDQKWQFVTAPDVADVLVEHKEQSKKLSRAALETLAIVAYHQPCTRADIEEVRGVAVAKGSLDQLLELGWLRLRGRRETPGRPVLYGTTSLFLEHFGLAEIGHLPGMADLKAAGLLDARLPPGFDVPVPRGDDDDIPDNAEGLVESDFATDFHNDGVDSGAVEASSDEGSLEMDSPFPDADDEPF